MSTILLFCMVDKENSFVCRPYHVRIQRYECPPRPLHPKMSRAWSYTQKEGLSRMMAIGIVLKSTHGQPVPEKAPRMVVVQRCEAWDRHRGRCSAALPLQRAHRVIRDDLPERIPTNTPPKTISSVHIQRAAHWAPHCPGIRPQPHCPSRHLSRHPG